MRKLVLLSSVAAAAVFGTMALSSASIAGNDWVCWMQPSGVTACGALPEPYHVRDIPYKPHKHNGLQMPCRHCSNDFRLTHPNIADFGNYTDNATMRRFHDASMYGSKIRGIRD